MFEFRAVCWLLDGGCEAGVEEEEEEAGGAVVVVVGVLVEEEKVLEEEAGRDCSIGTVAVC